MMNRWLSISALALALSSPSMALPAPAAPGAGGAAAAKPAATAAKTPAAQPAPLIRVGVPLVGQPVVTKVDFPGFSIREVTLLRRKDDSGQSVISARVRVFNTSAKSINPTFRVLLYSGRELLGQISFPSAAELPTAVAAGETLPWTRAVAVASPRTPDSLVIAPPEVIPHSDAVGAAVAPGSGRVLPGKPGTTMGRPAPTSTMPGARPGAGNPTGDPNRRRGERKN